MAAENNNTPANPTGDDHDDDEYFTPEEIEEMKRTLLRAVGGSPVNYLAGGESFQDIGEHFFYLGLEVEEIDEDTLWWLADWLEHELGIIRDETGRVTDESLREKVEFVLNNE